MTSTKRGLGVKAWKMRRMWEGYNKRHTVALVARHAHVSEMTVSKYYDLWRTGFTPEFYVSKAIIKELHPLVRCRIRAEARRRNLPVKNLIADVLTLVCNDKLFDAVLGEFDDETENRDKLKRSITGAI